MHSIKTRMVCLKYLFPRSRPRNPSREKTTMETVVRRVGLRRQGTSRPHRPPPEGEKGSRLGGSLSGADLFSAEGRQSAREFAPRRMGEIG